MQGSCHQEEDTSGVDIVGFEAADRQLQIRGPAVEIPTLQPGRVILDLHNENLYWHNNYVKSELDFVITI